MATEFQLKRIAQAQEAIGRQATAKQIWNYLSRTYPHSPGFKSRYAVGQVLRHLKRHR